MGRIGLNIRGVCQYTRASPIHELSLILEHIIKIKKLNLNA